MPEKIIKKAIITSGGLATRMMPFSRVVPKALVPLYVHINDKKNVVPIIDIIIKKLGDAGVIDYCIVTGGLHENVLKGHLGDSYNYIRQEKALGFGDAVLKGKSFAGSDPIYVHADDGVITGDLYNIGVSLFFEKNADAVLFLRKVENPKKSGIANVSNIFRYNDFDVYTIDDIVEKPNDPKGNFGATASYIFSNKIFDFIESAGKSSSTGEIELTEGIRKLIHNNGKVYGIMLKDSDKWLNIGDPDSYYKTMDYTFKNKIL